MAETPCVLNKRKNKKKKYNMRTTNLSSIDIGIVQDESDHGNKKIGL
jgi:hypothetical protein